MTWKLRPLLKIGAVLGASALGLAAYPQFAQGADHTDGAGVQASPIADINDIYAWTSPDAAAGDTGNLYLAMSYGGLATVTPDDSTLYDFNVTRGAVPEAVMPDAGTISHVRCGFDAAGANIECWVIDSAGTVVDYVTAAVGDENGATSENGTRVFAGPRNDAFAFDIVAFNDATETAANLVADGTVPAEAFNADGCLDDDGVAATVRGLLFPEGTSDTFANANPQHIVLSVPKSLFEGSGDTYAVWASTNQR